MPHDTLTAFAAWLAAHGFDVRRMHPREINLLRACYDAEQPAPCVAAAPIRVPRDARVQLADRGPALEICAAAPLLQICGASEGFAVIEAAEGAADKTPHVSMTAYTGVPMRLPGFYHPVIVDLDSAHPVKGSVPFLRDHDPSRIAGHGEVEITPQGIRAAGPLSGLPEHTAELVHTGKGGFPWQASIGASADRIEFTPKGESVKVNGRGHDGPVHVARGATVREISLVPMGADGNTSAAVAASYHEGRPMKFAAWLEAKGHAAATLTPERRAQLKAEWRKEHPKPPVPVAQPVAQPVDLAADMAAQLAAGRASAAAEVARVNGVRRICAASPGLMTDVVEAGATRKVAIEEHAIAAGWTVEQAELAVLRASRHTVTPHVHLPGTPAIDGRVIEAAVLQAGGYTFTLADKATYTDPILQAAHTHFKGRIGLQQVLIAGAEMTGRRVPQVIRGDDDLAAVLHAGFTPDIRADGASTSSLGNVLANVLNKYLMQGYRFVESTWRDLTAIMPVRDFKPTKSINLLGDLVFKKVNSDGQLEHGSLADQAFANQADTYGRTMTITRQMTINDDLSALTTVPILVGRGSGLAINTLFWTLFLAPGNGDDGQAFWNASGGAPNTHGSANSGANTFSGAGSALSSAALQTAVALFDAQVDPKNQPLGLEAAILLYPPQLQVPADELMKSQQLVYGGSAAAKQPATNVWQGRFKQLKGRYLSNASYTGYSATAWYLLADPGIMPVIQVCFLNGQEQPTVQTAMADFRTLGIDLRGFWDFGVAMQNFRGGVKAAGA